MNLVQTDQHVGFWILKSDFKLENNSPFTFFIQNVSIDQQVWINSTKQAKHVAISLKFYFMLGQNMRLSISWKNNLQSRINNEAFDKQQKIILSFTKASKLTYECINSFKPNTSLCCIAVSPI